ATNQIPEQQGTKSTPKKRSPLEWIAICCGGAILLVIVAAFIAGMYQGVSSTPSSSQITGDKTTDLNMGDSVTLNYNGEQESVTITDFNQTSGDVGITTKNVGDKAITEYGDIYVVDWGGVRHDVDPLSELAGRVAPIGPVYRGKWGNDSFYPGD